MHVLVTGAAGFIGSNLVDRLLAEGHAVKGIDNFTTGQKEFLATAISNPNFELVELDLLDFELLVREFEGVDLVFHLAANADIRFGLDNPRKDLEQNTIVTFNVLEAMRLNNVKKIAFSSTGSVYGDATVIPTPENAPFPVQTSLYAASKVAGEGLIQAYCNGFEFQAWIFRFVSILGERYTHGHVFDFYKNLKSDPTSLYILGNGLQKKSYLYVGDCIDAILMSLSKATDKINVLNLGVDDYCEIKDSAKWIADALQLSPEYKFAGGERGWVGDNPFIFLDTRKIQSIGWRPKHSIKDGVLKTVNYLANNEWIFKARGSK